MALHLTILCLSYAKKSDSESGSRDLSKTWSEQIDYLLKQGHRILKAERVGSGKKTKYYFTPVVAPYYPKCGSDYRSKPKFSAIVDLLLVIADQYSHRLFKTPIEVQSEQRQ